MRALPSVLAISAIAFFLGTAVSQRPDGNPTGPFGPLKVGDKVVMREKGGRYEFTQLLAQPEAFSHRVVEMGKDFVCVEDMTAFHRIWIPVTSVQSVTRVQFGR